VTTERHQARTGLSGTPSRALEGGVFILLLMSIPDTPLDLGLDTFGDVTIRDGRTLSQAQVLRDIVEEAVLADEIGVDFIGVGEHHRPDFAISAPEVVLAAIATRTSRIRLGSAVTVLSSDDPVRVFQRFSTVDALSNGRAEIILGRGSFAESFPLFGYSLQDYEVLFNEKLDLFAAILASDSAGTPIDWSSASGTVQGPARGLRVYPPTESHALRTWIGVGGSPESVRRAAQYGLPMTLAIIGGDPRRFLPYAELYRSLLKRLDKPLLPLGVHSPGYVAESDAQAREELWPSYRGMRDRIGVERGWPATSLAEFEQEIEHGSLYVGAPETVARKIAATASALGITRFDMKYSAGTLSHERMMQSIRLYGTEVIPRVRELLVPPK
jgi:probable LLM family oxidoreductase